jgi:hypothetical protein
MRRSAEQPVPQRALGVGVQRAGQVVEDEQLRPPEGPRGRGALELAAGQPHPARPDRVVSSPSAIVGDIVVEHGGPQRRGERVLVHVEPQGEVVAQLPVNSRHLRHVGAPRRDHVRARSCTARRSSARSPRPARPGRAGRAAAWSCRCRPAAQDGERPGGQVQVDVGDAPPKREPTPKPLEGASAALRCGRWGGDDRTLRVEVQLAARRTAAGHRAGSSAPMRERRPGRGGAGRAGTPPTAAAPASQPR